MKKPTVIAFSGGCFSGKTSTIEALEKILISKNIKVIKLNELMRNFTKNLSIDTLRTKFPNMYFKIEKQVISNKISDEEKAKKFYKDDTCVILIDRALTDSLFYYENYVRPIELASYKDKEEYYKFRSYLIDKIKEHFAKIYDLLVEFKPLDAQNNKDNINRPDDAALSNRYEYECIKRLNFYYSINTGIKSMEADLTSSNSNDLIYKILKKIGLE